ncbi:kinase-like domain-containing protein [Collybia nuda]|uniref:non-specific serine/threonine protein kinase n=1 Tax=Collybia nuda TaxID=64659 RepID=A0A9P5Y6T8_9AGAR|nr:kinase-like domain-containing protein [Collybia nuda]
MPGIIRLSETVTLRLNTHSDTPDPSSLRITIKPKMIRQALVGITNTTEDGPLLDSVGDACEASILPLTPGPTSPAPSHSPREIKRLPRRCPPGPFYRLGPAGEGTFSKIIAVRDLRSKGGAGGRVLCLKVFEKEKLRNEGAERVVVQELRAFQTLTAAAHDKWLPFVMRMEASMEDTERIIFAMELMDCDLLTVMFDWEEEKVVKNKKRWIAEMATGIAAIHSAGIIHRDMKPENVLVDFANTVRITDFGCSYVAYPAGRPLEPRTPYCSRVTGTIPYHSPEVMANKGIPREDKTEYGIATDYWGLGCVIYELETCGEVKKTQDTIEPLFQTKEALDAYINLRTPNNKKRYEPLEGLDEDIFDLISGLLHPSPSSRYGEREVRCHDYFFNNNSRKSEFIGIEARGLALNTLPDKRDVPERVLYMEDPSDEEPNYSPVAYTPRGTQIGSDFSNVGWINPRGIWGPMHNDPAFYTTRPN